MIATVLIVVGYLATYVATYKLAQRLWLQTFDFTTSDRIFFLLWSLGGPITLAVLGLMFGIDRLSSREARVLKERRR